MNATTCSDGSGGRILFDFRESAPESWHSTDDPVMGGRSHSNLLRCESQTAIFTGHVSLENNGGFASVHAPLRQGTLSGCRALVLCLQGDGRRYSLRLRQHDAYDGIAYRQDFATRDFSAEAEQWQEITLPLARFDAVFRGRDLPSAGPLQPGRVEQIGFLIGRQPGDFALRIRWIAAIDK